MSIRTATIALALLGTATWLVAPADARSSSAAGALVLVDDDIDERPDKRPEVAELCDRLKGHVKRKGDEDDAALDVIDQLVIEFRASGPKDRGTIVKSISKCFDARRSPEEIRENGEIHVKQNNQLYLAAAVALGEMGPESVKSLEGWIGHKRHRGDIELQRRLTQSLGKTADPKALPTLIDLLTHKDAALVAAAAEALAYFENEPSKTRKEIFEAMLKALMSAKGQVDSDVNDVIARERYNTFSASLITSLVTISGHEERNPQAIQRWWNKNKRDDWDADRS